MCDGEKLLAIKEECIEVFNQCPTEDHKFEDGILSVIWPHVKGVATPTVEWLHDETLKTDSVNLLEDGWNEIQSGKEFWDRLGRKMNWHQVDSVRLRIRGIKA